MPNLVNKTMLIDDSEIDLFIHRRFLELCNFSRELIAFKSAETAIESLKNLNGDEPPNIIFLDLNMPDADGFTFLKHFKDLPATVTEKSRIVVLTSSESNIDRDYVLTFQEVIHLITKPIKQTDIEDLRIIFK